jgi:haloacetate dehalogenase
VPFFDGFDHGRASLAGIEIPYATAGSGPALLLLHGHPQTRAIWHRVAPRLAERFTVVASDLRGYGDASKPAGGEGHAAYAKRAMAADQVALMRSLGHDAFLVCGHDRGGRVAHRMALDHPDAVRRLMVLDIAPTLAMYEQTDMAFARAYWHWFFLIQPAPFPETLIGADPEAYLRQVMGGRHAGLSAFAPEAWSEYLRCARDPATIRAMCEDYRAAATVDLSHDRADRAAGRGLAMPLAVLWGEHGVVGRCFDPLAEWRRAHAQPSLVRGRALPCGHYIPEEAPEALLAEMLDFFA